MIELEIKEIEILIEALDISVRQLGIGTNRQVFDIFDKLKKAKDELLIKQKEDDTTEHIQSD